MANIFYSSRPPTHQKRLSLNSRTKVFCSQLLFAPLLCNFYSDIRFLCVLWCQVSLLTCRYIEFYDVMSVPMAIAMSGQLFLGQPVMVKPSEAEKNLAQSNTTAGGGTGPVDRKLYVGNLHFNMTELQLRQVFSLISTLLNSCFKRYIASWQTSKCWWTFLIKIFVLTFFSSCCQIFEPFGPVELVQLPCDLETGQCKGFGFIQVCRTRFQID